ncbi:MAG: hypothetical protein QNJ91_03425 [Gammaproteobacteria bacterium]|nr:hypothetical protein [Gammaproteobacteria bacterium]
MNLGIPVGTPECEAWVMGAWPGLPAAHRVSYYLALSVHYENLLYLGAADYYKGRRVMALPLLFEELTCRPIDKHLIDLIL